MRIKLQAAIVGTVMLVGSAYYTWHTLTEKQQKTVVLDTQEKRAVDTILKNRKTYCIGNYNIELPDGMVLYEKTKPVVRFDGSTLTSKRMYYPAFEQRIRLRENELKQTSPIDPNNGDYLKAIHPLGSGMKGIVFERMESVSVPDSARILEAHFYKDNTAFLLEMNGRNGESTRYDKYRNEYPALYANNIPKKLIELNNLIAHIHGRDDGLPNSFSGLCIPNGFLDISVLSGVQQDIVVNLASNDNPQLSVTLESRNYDPDSESLLSFRSYAESSIHDNGGYVIRKGEKDISNLHVQEWLAKSNNHEKKEEFDFYLLVNGQQASENKPVLFLNLKWEQKGTNENITDAGILAVWDEIIKTIKLH